MNTQVALALPAVVLAATLAGCRPYDAPEFAEIAPHETAFLIPLEGDTRRQAKFDSAEYLDRNKVAVKRVRITHGWSQRGRMWWDGRWEDTVRLVTVDRTPVTREWTAAAGTGTSPCDQAIHAASRDCVDFSIGFTCTACVRECDAARYLYLYRGDSLADAMDSEIRARLQTDVSDMAARYDFEYLRMHKAEIMERLRLDLLPFFSRRGITITALGMVGGLTSDDLSARGSVAAGETTITSQRDMVTAPARSTSRGLDPALGSFRGAHAPPDDSPKISTP